MEFDEVLIHLGQFGKYQIILFIIVCLFSLQSGFNVMGIVFIAGTPKHWCKSPEIKLFNLSLNEIKNLTIPLVDKDGEIVYSSCERFKEPYYNWTTDDFSDRLDLDPGNRSNELCPHGWDYDSSVYTSTIVSQWDLVCDSHWLKSTASSVFMAGLCAGVISTTVLSDIIGRRPILLVTVPLTVISTIALSFSPNFTTFCVLRFFIACFGFGESTCAFVLMMEVIGPDYRMLAGIATGYFWAVGYLGYAAIAYYIRDWSTLNLVASCSTIPLLFTVFYISESPRWLYVHGQNIKADQIIRKIAKVNKVQLMEIDHVDIEEDKKGYIWDLFRTPHMACRTVNMCFTWFVASCVYFGLSLNTSNLGGNDYVNFAIAGALEFPAYLTGQLSLNYFGRRIPLIASMLLGAVTLLCTLAVPHGLNWLLITLSMAGKFGVTTAFGIIYVFTAELFPTTVRSVGLGTCSFSARIGGIISPFIGDLSIISKLIPMIIFGVMALSAGFLALLFPETKGKSLPETLQDGENFGRKTKTPYDSLEVTHAKVQEAELVTDGILMDVED